jgi:hypothetical protein
MSTRDAYIQCAASSKLMHVICLACGKDAIEGSPVLEAVWLLGRLEKWHKTRF